MKLTVDERKNIIFHEENLKLTKNNIFMIFFAIEFFLIVIFTQPGPGRALPAQLFGKFSPTRAWSDYGHASCFTVSARALDGT